MSNDEIQEIVLKLKYQVSILAEAVSYESYPVQALILSMDWDRGDIQKAYDIFDKYEKILEEDGAINHSALEADFQAVLGVGYQRLKSVVIAFWRNDQWIDVCEAYVKSHGNAVPIELKQIIRGKGFNRP